MNVIFTSAIRYSGTTMADGLEVPTIPDKIAAERPNLILITPRAPAHGGIIPSGGKILAETKGREVNLFSLYGNMHATTGLHLATFRSMNNG